MDNVIRDYLEALDERASQVGGLNQGQQYIIGFLYGTLKNLKLKGYDLEILERVTKQLKGMIQSEKEWNEKNI